MGHAEVRIEDLEVPDDNIAGRARQGVRMGQHRLGYGRLRHGMWSIAKAQAALDMAAERSLERVTFGKRSPTGRASNGCSPTAPRSST